MAEIFDCPSCGASLELDQEHDNLVRCQHCGKNVVIPESLRRKPKAPVQQIENPVMTVQTAVNWEPPQKTNIGRFVSCLVIFIIVFTIGTTILAVAAPLVVTGMVAKVLGDTGLFEGLIPTQVAGASPQISITVPSADDFIQSPTPPEPGFARQIFAFGGEGTGPGRFDDTRSVTVDKDGYIYTAEYSDHRVQKFSPDGKYELGWLAEGSNAVMSMAASRNGTIYVVSTGKIFKYDTQGQLVGQVENPSGDYIESVAITADNGLVAASNESIYRFDSGEKLMFQIDQAYQPASENGSIIGDVAVDGLGNIYAPIQFTEQNKFKTSIFVFGPGGKYIDRFGSEGDEPGQYRALNTLAVDGQGRLYVSDIRGIQVFSSEGNYLDQIDLEGVAFGLWFDDSGVLYVASNADQIFIYEILE